MRFRLVYQGTLTSARGSRREEKQRLREHFHPQLKQLWALPRMRGHQGCLVPSDERSILESVGGFAFAPLVTDKLALCAHLSVLFMRPEPPGGIYSSGGDIDNRLKTLLDGLRMPVSKQELPPRWQPNAGQDPLFCLLQDDALVTGVSVDSDRWLKRCTKKPKVLIVVTVQVDASSVGMNNIDLLG